MHKLHVQMKQGKNKSAISAIIRTAFIVFLVAYGTSASASAVPVSNDETAILCCTDSSYGNIIPDILNEGDLPVSTTAIPNNNKYAGDRVFIIVSSRSLAYCLLITDLPPPQCAA
jgi:hypothetical protein